MSVGLGADPGFLAVSSQVTLVINAVVGCRYFLIGLPLLFPAKEIAPCPVGRYQIILPGDRGIQVYVIQKGVINYTHSWVDDFRWNPIVFDGKIKMDSHIRGLSRLSGQGRMVAMSGGSRPNQFCKCVIVGLRTTFCTL